MFSNIIALLLVFRSTFAFIQCESDLNHLEWLKGLRKYINQDSSAYQTLLIINQDLFKTETKVEKILREIKPIKPSIQFLVQNVTATEAIRDLKQLPIFRFPRTTFIIIIDFPHDLNIAQETIKVIKTSLKGSFRPKCLVLQFSELQTSLDSNKETFFKNAWDSQFLDLSILEIVGNTSKVQYYNPFMEIFSTRRFTSKTSLFPDKLQNMNGFKLKAGSHHMPPSIYIQRNSTGYPIKAVGPSLNIFEAFATSMNFKIHVETGYGEKNPATELFHRMFQNKIQFSLVQGITKEYCRDSCLEHLVTRIGSFHGLTPKMQDNQTHFTLWSFLYSLYPIAIFSVMLWLLMYTLKLYSHNWNLSFTMQVVLGLTVPQEPTNWKARIIFAYMVIVSFMYSSQLHAMLTNANLQSASDAKLTTLAELNASGLVLILDPVTINWMQKDFQKLSIVKQSLKRFASVEECTHHVITERNISCLMSKEAADFCKFRFRDVDGNSLIDIVEEPFLTSTQGFYLEPGSPYAERFNGLLLRLIASGVYQKWNKDYVPATSISKMEKEALDDLVIGRNQLLPVLVTILLVGYFISGISFVIEVAVVKIKKVSRGRTLGS